MNSSHPNTNSKDLTQLARLYVTGSDAFAIESDIAIRNLDTVNNQLDWMLEIIQSIWLGHTAELLYATESQSNRENLEVYVGCNK